MAKKQTAYRPPRTFGWHATYEELADEFTAWGVVDWEAQPNVMLSRANSTNLSRTERAVTVTFIKDGKRVTLPMDQYESPTQNLKVLALCINDMRMIERRGLHETMQSAYLQLGAPDQAGPWRVLGLNPGASRQDIEQAYRQQAQNAHPDHGGSDAAMAELNRARDEALKVAAS